MKYLIVMLLALFTTQAQSKIEIFDAQGNKIKEIIKESNNKNIIEPYELKAHEQYRENQNLKKQNQELIRQNRELRKEINKLKIQNKEFEKNLILGNRIKEYRVADDTYIYENVKEKQMREGSGAIAEMYKIGGSAIAALIFGVFLARFFRKKSKHELAE